MAKVIVTFQALYEQAETTVKNANASLVERSTRRKLQAGIDDCDRQIDELAMANLEELKKLEKADFQTIANNTVESAQLEAVKKALEELEAQLFPAGTAAKA